MSGRPVRGSIVAGRVATRKGPPSGGVWAVMSAFDVDVDRPKAEHISFLDHRVLPILLGKKARIWLQGTASSTGTEVHNLGLSRRRANNVAEHLKSRGADRSQIQIEAIGESFASTKIVERFHDDRSDGSQ